MITAIKPTKKFMSGVGAPELFVPLMMMIPNTRMNRLIHCRGRRCFPRKMTLNRAVMRIFIRVQIWNRPASRFEMAIYMNTFWTVYRSAGTACRSTSRLFSRACVTIIRFAFAREPFSKTMSKYDMPIFMTSHITTAVVESYFSGLYVRA